MPDAQFEKTFADLAHARLRDRAPGLLDYLLGFQLLDKNEDDTHAVGLWGFKIGEELLYAPVFFLNGQLKGDDLLYLKSQDAFVPLKENWINYLLNRRPYVLGETEFKDQADLGVMQPDFNTFARPPYSGSKYSSSSLRGIMDRLTDSVESNFRPFLPVIVSSPAGEKRASLSTNWHLPNFIRKAGHKAARVFLNTMKKNATFTDSVLKFYKMDEIIDAAKEAFANAPMEKVAADGDKMIEGTAPKVQIMISDRADVLDLDDEMLSDAEKEKLQRDRYLVTDNRSDDETGTVYDKQISKTLQNPSMSCYTNVLMTGGDFEKRLIMIAAKGCEKWRNHKRNMATVIDVSGGKLIMAQPRDIFTDNEGHDSDGWEKAFSALPDCSTAGERQKVVFVNEKGEGTTPFIVQRKISSDGQTMLYGEFDEWPQAAGSCDKLDEILYPDYRGRAFNQSDSSTGRFGGEMPYTNNDEPCIVLTNKDGNNVTQIGKDFFVPNGFKCIKMIKEMTDPWKIDKSESSYQKEKAEQRAKIDQLANTQTLADIEMQLFKSAGAKEIQAITDGIEWWVRDNNTMGSPMSKIAAIRKLVIDYQLREKDALGILSKAARNGSPKYIVKMAQPTAPPIPDPMVGTDPSLTTAPPVLYPQEDNISANQTPMDRYNTPMDMDATFQAEQAAQQGQKEVLDTSVISGLVKVMDPDTVVDNYIGDLMLGLDRVGRILFMYYWHFDKFKERYGSQDMPELEDNLKNVFDNLGDLTIFLKQKTIEPDVSDAVSETELEQII